MVDAMRASYALPGIFRPVAIEGRWLFDGALVNPIPVSVCRALGARYVIAVSVNSELCGRGTVIPHLEALPPSRPSSPSPTASDEGLFARNGRAMKKLLQRQFFGRTDNSPGISRVMVEAFNIVQDRISRSRLAGDPPDMIIQPRLPDTAACSTSIAPRNSSRPASRPSAAISTTSSARSPLAAPRPRCWQRRRSYAGVQPLARSRC